MTLSAAKTSSEVSPPELARGSRIRNRIAQAKVIAHDMHDADLIVCCVEPGDARSGVGKSTISVRVRAGAHRDEVAGVLERTLLVRVAAPAHDGRANRALCRLLAERLGVAPSRVVIVRGRRSREKLVEVDGIDQATVDRALSLAPR